MNPDARLVLEVPCDECGGDGRLPVTGMPGRPDKSCHVCFGKGYQERRITLAEFREFVAELD